MTNLKPTDAVVFHSRIAAQFHESYRADLNRLDRLEVFRDHLTRYATRVECAYDLGCGSGMLTLEVAPLAKHVVAIDGASGMLDLARETVAQRGWQNVTFLCARLPIKETDAMEKADLAIASSVIEYLDSVEEALDFARRLLKPAGLLIFSMSNKDSVSRKIVRAIHRFTGRPSYLGLIKHFVNESDIRRVLENAQFEYVSHTYFSGQDRLNRFLAAFFPKRFVTNMILIVARRPA